jgi:hypothetical protein
MTVRILPNIVVSFVRGLCGGLKDIKKSQNGNEIKAGDGRRAEVVKNESDD